LKAGSIIFGTVGTGARVGVGKFLLGLTIGGPLGDVAVVAATFPAALSTLEDVPVTFEVSKNAFKSFME
jgi:hypothetical protein